MRGAPHRGFASDIVRIKARTSAVTVGRPRRRLFQAQTRRKPRRCHARIVSGFTMTTIRQSRHTRDNHTQSTRSAGVRRTRRGRDRSRTWSWCRRARISRCSLARDRTDERRARSNEMTTDDIDQQPTCREPQPSMNAATTEFSVGTAGQRADRACATAENRRSRSPARAYRWTPQLLLPCRGIAATTKQHDPVLGQYEIAGLLVRSAHQGAPFDGTMVVRGDHCAIPLGLLFSSLLGTAQKIFNVLRFRPAHRPERSPCRWEAWPRGIVPRACRPSWDETSPRPHRRLLRSWRTCPS
jgi:hypothetical protein